ncbi:MAG TPA: RNA polymerase sigma factor [Polyangia bacterium]|nr:RNA polymerase sigma factor [Polyangia bacterium]
MDEPAVDEAYRLYASSIWRRCASIVRSEAAAMDITHEVFVRCLRHHRKLRPGRELLAWLYRTATNLCLNDLRDRRVRGERTLPAEPSQDAAGEPGQPVDFREPEAAARLLTAEVLQGLDRRVQEVAVYVFVDGMTHAEAAEVAGVSERTVRNCLARFLAHGRERLGLDLRKEGA